MQALVPLVGAFIAVSMALTPASASWVGASVGLNDPITWEGEADLIGGCPAPFVSMVHTGETFALPGRSTGELVMALQADATWATVDGDLSVADDYVGPGPMTLHHFYAPAFVLVSYETWCYQHIGFWILVIRFSGYGAGAGESL